jgi:hypothetical protein
MIRGNKEIKRRIGICGLLPQAVVIVPQLIQQILGRF